MTTTRNTPTPRNSRAKAIAVDDLTFRFEQRSVGEETPYWVGSIFDNGIRIGTFSNDGRGGATLVTPRAVQDRLRKMVDDAAPGVVTHAERYELVLYCAEFRGYTKKCRNLTLKDYVTAWADNMNRVTGT